METHTHTNTEAAASTLEHGRFDLRFRVLRTLLLVSRAKKKAISKESQVRGSITKGKVMFKILQGDRKCSQRKRERAREGERVKDKWALNVFLTDSFLQKRRRADHEPEKAPDSPPPPRAGGWRTCAAGSSAAWNRACESQTAPMRDFNKTAASHDVNKKQYQAPKRGGGLRLCGEFLPQWAPLFCHCPRPPPASPFLCQKCISINCPGKLMRWGIPLITLRGKNESCF